MPEIVVLKLDHYLLKLVNVNATPLFKEFVAVRNDCCVQVDCEVDLILSNTSSGIELTWNKENRKSLSFHIDIHKVIKQLRTFPAPKQGAFNQALGKKTRSIIDATGGWGGDTLLMCTQGYQVTIIERNPIMALLLADAMWRLSRTDWANVNGVFIPKVVNQNAIDYFKASDNVNIDCVYLDPMFPPKKKKSAAVNKQMKLLQWLVGADHDASQLLESVATCGVKRAAVKRPSYAEPLYRKPSTQFSSKLVHYDVYLFN